MTKSHSSQRRGRMSAKRWPWAVLAIAVLAASGGGYYWLSQSSGDSSESQSPQAPLVRAAPAEGVETLEIVQTGFVRPTDQIDIVPQISERIVSVAPEFQVGADIANGAVLLNLDLTQARADARTAEANVAQASAALDEARITLNRQRQLRREDVVSDAAFEDAQVAFARAEANLAMAEAELQRAQLAVDDTTIIAPFDAIVTQQTASVGQFVQAGASVGHIVATESVEIAMGLLPADLALLGRADAAIGREVTIRDLSSDERLTTGRVDAVVPVIEDDTRTVTLVVRVSRPFETTELRIGDLVGLTLPVPLTERAAFRLPAEAVKSGDRVWRITDGTLSGVDVQVLSRTGNTVVVRGAALSDGAPVMISDLVAPADGIAVRVAEQPVQVAEGR